MTQEKSAQPDEPTQALNETGRGDSRRDEGAGGNAPGNAESGPTSAAAGSELSELRERLAAAEAKAAENHELYLRAVAEAENIRRRAQEDVAKAHKFGIEAFAESLLPAKDSLELALASDAPTVENLKEGVGATLRLLASAFEKHRLAEIDPRGEKFDPNRHQAISTVPASGMQPPVPAGHVAHVLQKGYLIADRVLRPALVTVVQG